ncbi:MAG TPA: alpha/beta hydrolase [Anaeromyxobacter sp.]
MAARALRLVAAVAAALAVLAALALVLLWLAQRRLLYFPDRADRRSAEERARRLGLEPWVDGGELLGWRSRLPGGAARGRLVVLHGNAGSALDRSYFAAAFRLADPARPLEVYLVEYPGYGSRAGAPSEDALVAAARRAIALARADGDGPLLLAGESLGGAVAALAAAADPAQVDGLLLVTPLASVPAVARRHYFPLPEAFYRDAYRADLALPRYAGAVAFLLAGRDEVVFPDLCRALHDRAPGPKRIWEDPLAGHNTLSWDPSLQRWREMVEFLARPGGR